MRGGAFTGYLIMISGVSLWLSVWLLRGDPAWVQEGEQPDLTSITAEYHHTPNLDSFCKGRITSEESVFQVDTGDTWGWPWQSWGSLMYILPCPTSSPPPSLTVLRVPTLSWVPGGILRDSGLASALEKLLVSELAWSIQERVAGHYNTRLTANATVSELASVCSPGSAQHGAAAHRACLGWIRYRTGVGVSAMNSVCPSACGPSLLGVLRCWGGGFCRYSPLYPERYLVQLWNTCSLCIRSSG